MRAMAILASSAMTIGLTATSPAQSVDRAPVSLLRVPGGGVQPQAVVDDRGRLHLVYFSGAAGDGNLFYVRADRGGAPLTPAIRVNSEPDSAIATGNVRGARLAVAGGGRVHVTWNGSSRAQPRGPGNATPMLYTRMNEAGTAFEPQRNLLTSATGLDGGGAIATAADGRVVVAWHAGGPASTGEGDRRVWIAESADGGRRFARERAISDPATGACGCCGMASTFDQAGSLYLLYRSARDLVHRDTFLLRAPAAAPAFSSRQLDSWNLPACSMSTYALAAQGTRVWAAWENDGRIHFARVDRPSPMLTVAGNLQNRKHPALAVNARGEVLVAWTEGMGWNRGGSLGWQIFAADGSPTSQSGRADGVPVWSLVAAVAQPDASFTVIY